MKCEICNKEFGKVISLQHHLRNSHKEINQQAYYIFFINSNYRCEFCGKRKAFLGFTRGFRGTCGDKSCIDKQKKKVSFEKYGVENISQLNSIKEKKKQTCLKNYGVENPGQSEIVKKKMKETIEARYGVENASQSDIIKKKKEKTCLEHFGTKSPFESEIVKEKIDKTNLEKWGTIVPQENKKIKEKIKKTHNNKSDEEISDMVEKIKKTKKERYGDENYTNIDKYKETCIEKYGVDNLFKTGKFIEENNNRQLKAFYDKLINSDRLKGLVKPLFSLDEYKGSKVKKYKFECVECGRHFKDFLQAGRIPRCYKCYPTRASSNVERSLQRWLESLNIKIERNERFYSSNKVYELDIYLPDYTIGIELNGIYWHSEKQGKKDKNYHLDKTNFFKDNYNIQVLHFWDIEWIEKRKIVQSIILSKLKRYENIFYARKCELREIKDRDIVNEFLENNHLQGSLKGYSFSFGVYYNNELQSVMIFGKPRFNKKIEWEVLRYCTKLNSTVIGGFSKFIKNFYKLKSKSLLCYIDKRYGSIDKEVYKSLFNEINESKPNYYYTKDYKQLFSRFKFQKHKLKEILPIDASNLTEWENMQINKYDRVWDCGNYVLINNKEEEPIYV